MKSSSLQNGFTLIELMVVISIIGTLSTIVLGSLQQARMQANDSKRLQEIQQMQTALELYRDDHGGQYPNSDMLGGGNWDTSGTGVSGPDFIAPLADGGYLPNLKDPTTNDSFGNFRYYRYTPGYGGCDPAKGSFYVVEIGQFDVATPQNPGFKCGAPPPCSVHWGGSGPRDWTCEGAYVVGKFENQ
jgi:prepilin-type N-terminal cleavage/methylation domain-containing protein